VTIHAVYTQKAGRYQVKLHPHNCVHPVEITHNNRSWSIAMSLEWPIIDRWLMGEAWVNSRLSQHILHLCDAIGPRWASSPAEAQTVAYINEQMRAAGLSNVAAEEYTLHTWRLDSHQATVVENSGSIAILPFNRCPSCDVTGAIVDVGFGTPHWIEDAAEKLAGAIAVVNLGLEPFSPPVPLTDRLRALADAGVIAAVVVDRKDGGRVEYHSAGDWRAPGPDVHPLRLARPRPRCSPAAHGGGDA
jgi:hypothetical protein